MARAKHDQKKPTVAVVVNIDAKRAAQSIGSVRQACKKHGFKLMVCTAKDFDYTIRKALELRSLKRLIVGGGDGSVGKAASLILRFKPKVELAVLPLGTANYYSRTLGIHKSPAKALEVALSGLVEPRHVCKANSHYFLIGINIGATSRMFAEVTDRQKQRYGRFAYFQGVLKVLFDTRYPDLHITVNKKTRKFASTELVILNQRIPEAIRLTPDVDGGLPYFEIITYGLGNNKLSPLFAVGVFALTFGRNQRYLKRIRATEATIESHRPHIIAIDGEVVGSLPLKVTVIKEPVNFIRAA